MALAMDGFTMSPNCFANRFAADQTGGPLVETAMVLLPFMLIIAMVIEGGNILWRHQIALKSVRDATRYLTRVQLLFDQNCNLDPSVLVRASAAAKTLAVSGLIDGGPSLIPNWTDANIVVPLPEVVATDPCTVVVRAIARVDLPLPFAPVFQLFDPDQPSTISYSVADRARWSGE